MADHVKFTHFQNRMCHNIDAEIRIDAPEGPRDKVMTTFQLFGCNSGTELSGVGMFGAAQLRVLRDALNERLKELEGQAYEWGWEDTGNRYTCASEETARRNAELASHEMPVVWRRLVAEERFDLGWERA